MKTYTTQQVERQVLLTHTCDRCGCDLKVDAECYEYLPIEFVAGYGSVFGDGNHVSGDFCQRCVQQCLGQWLRIQPQHGQN